MNILRLASADEPVAHRQASRMRALLRDGTPDTRVTSVIYRTSDDPREQFNVLAGALIRQEADVAAYPASRLPLGPLPNGISLGAAVRDRDPRYRCIARSRPLLTLLPDAARVAVLDPTARSQIRHNHPRLLADLVRTPAQLLDGLRRGSWDAACVPSEVLDAASLPEFVTHSVSEEEILPTVGQGVATLLLTTRPGPAIEPVRNLSDPLVENALHAERAFVRHAGVLDGTVCAARGAFRGGRLELRGLIAGSDGSWVIRDEAMAPGKYSRILAEDVAAACRKLARPHASPSETHAKQEVMVNN